MNTSDDELADTPPMAPLDEVHGIENGEFARTCLESALKYAAMSAGELGPPLLTRSERWGFVWRADFTVGGQSPGELVNRIIIWGQSAERTQAVIAIGQDVPPLHG